MSQGPETTFIQSVHRLLPQKVYRMKNHNEYNGGIADCWYDGPNSDLWLEYKYVTLPKRPDTLVRIELSDLQKEWLRERWNNKRSVGVIVGCKDGGAWFTHPDHWEKSWPAATFRRMVMTRRSIAEAIFTTTHG